MHRDVSQKHKNHESGFTLVETMVAITVLLVAIVGPMTIASRGLQSAFFAKDQLAGLYLAQEAIELVRATRDANALAGGGTDWLAGFPAACLGSAANGCGVDARSPTAFVDCGGTQSNCRLNFDTTALGNSRGIYTYQATSMLSQFIRVIHVNELVNNVEAEVVVTVRWQTGLFGGGSKTITLQSRIFNQYAP